VSADSQQKVLGTETEFGITVLNQPDFNPVAAASTLVNSYAGKRARIKWSFDEESPGRDARGFGFDLTPSFDMESGLVNVVLGNGARFYVDHAHPEYSSPECYDPLEAALYDKAGEVILATAVKNNLGEQKPMVVFFGDEEGEKVEKGLDPSPFGLHSRCGC